MSKIRIKNFGPIKDGFKDETGNEWMDIKKVTLFIGNQGSGKSTVAKLISTFMWIEKALTRGDKDIKHFEQSGTVKDQYLTYHRIENYLQTVTVLTKENNSDCRSEIEYIGGAYTFKYINGNFEIQKNEFEYYFLPQIMYVPAERNFIANVKTPKALQLTSDSLIEFVSEFDKAKEDLKEPLQLPINKVQIEYQKLNDILYLKGEQYKIKLTEASSGFQSLAPLYLVSWYLSNSVKGKGENGIKMTSEQREKFRKSVESINEMSDLTEDLKRLAISAEAKKFNKTAFINIVEEPEQNLFPTSQKEMLFSLLEFNNMSPGNKLIMTTHSPYLLVYLSLCVEANRVKQRAKQDEIKSKLNNIVPLQSTLDGNELVVYQLDEVTGTIQKLKDYKGLPSDENGLNFGLIEANDLFSELLDLEDLCK